MKRPAETAGGIGGVAVVAARLFGIKDPDTLTAIGFVVGFLPAAITWIVTTVRGKRKPVA